jgi:hypothetical protein
MGWQEEGVLTSFRDGAAQLSWSWTAVLAGAIAACARQESAEVATARDNAAASAPSAGGIGGALHPSAAPPSVEPARSPFWREEEIVARMARETAQEKVRQEEWANERKSAWEEEQRRSAGATPATLLGTFTQDDVIRAASVNADSSLLWVTAEWHARKGTIAALSFRPTEFGYPVEKLEPRLVLLQERAGKLESLAERKLDLSRANCSNDSGEPAGGWDQAPKFALDLAAYSIAPGQTALGVRLTCMYTFPAGQGIDSQLFLVELRNGALRQVFEGSMETEDFQRPGATWARTKSVLVVQRTQHGGYFDLQLNSKVRIEGDTPEAREPTERTQTERFIWSGDHYVRMRAH